MGNIDDRPLGAVENGAVFMDRIERDYEFSCEAGSLNLCSDWIEFRRCFEVMADYIRHKSTSPASAADLKAENERLRDALTRISSPTQTAGLLWWQVEARAALNVETSNDKG